MCLTSEQKDFLKPIDDVEFEDRIDENGDCISFFGRIPHDNNYYRCEKCGNPYVKRNGTEKHEYRDLPFYSNKTKLKINDQRWICYECRKTRLQTSRYIDATFRMTTRLKEFVINRCYSLPQSSVSIETGVSTGSISKIISDYYTKESKNIRHSKSYILTTVVEKNSSHYTLCDVKKSSSVAFSRYSKDCINKLEEDYAVNPNNLEIHISAPTVEVIEDIAKHFSKCTITVDQNLFDRDYISKKLWESYKTLVKEAGIRTGTRRKDEKYLWFLEESLWSNNEKTLFLQITDKNRLFLAYFEARKRLFKDKYSRTGLWALIYNASISSPTVSPAAGSSPTFSYITGSPSTRSKMSIYVMNHFSTIESDIWECTRGARLDAEYKNIVYGTIDPTDLQIAKALGEAMARDDQICEKMRELKYSSLFIKREDFIPIAEENLDWMTKENLDWMTKENLDWMTKENLDWMTKENLDWKKGQRLVLRDDYMPRVHLFDEL